MWQISPVIVPVREPVIVPVREPVIVPTLEPVMVPVRVAREPVMVPADADDATARPSSAARAVVLSEFILFLLVNFGFAGNRAGSELLLSGGGSI